MPSIDAEGWSLIFARNEYPISATNLGLFVSIDWCDSDCKVKPKEFPDDPLNGCVKFGTSLKASSLKFRAVYRPPEGLVAERVQGLGPLVSTPELDDEE